MPKKTIELIIGRNLPEQANPIAPGTIFLWDRVGKSGDNSVSLTRLLDDRFDEMQSLFVEWRDSLCALKVGRKSLGSALKLARNEDSMWWSTAIAATPPESLPRVADILKLCILEQFFVKGGFRKLFLIGPHSPLVEVLRSWCKEQGYAFEWTRVRDAQAEKPTLKNRLYERLPHAIQALLYLKSFLFRWARLRCARSSDTRRRDWLDVAVVTHFPNINLDLARKGEFHSSYWGSLHRLLRHLGLKVHWIWFFTDSAQMRLAEATDYMARFNARSEVTGQSYSFVEDRLSIVDILRALGRYLRIAKVSVTFRSCRRHFRLDGSSINFFPLIGYDWFSSLRGTNAMFASLYSAAFRTSIQALPPSTGRMLYLWENQGWEHLVLDAWKSTRAAPIIGAAHAPNCTAPRLLRNRLGAYKRAVVTSVAPDKLIAIGAQAAAAFRRLGWPADIIQEAEALRYEHLMGKYDSERRAIPESGRHLLVACGILRSELRIQLELLSRAEALGGLDKYSTVTIKPHPFCAIETELGEILFRHVLCVSNDPMPELLQRADAVYCASSTSVSLEAAWMGVPLILLRAADDLDHNPLAGIQGVAVTATPEELTEQLRHPTRIEIGREFLLLNSELPYWRALLTEPVPTFR